MTYINDNLLNRLRGLSDEPEPSGEGGAGEGDEAPPGRFTLDARIGAGGMGEVFRARDELTGRWVAIKLLDAYGGEDYERFRREATLLRSLSHPAIVRYVAHGKLGTRAFLAMDWLEGETLGERLAREGLTVSQSVALAWRIAEALAVGHERGIVHRDVKPTNVFLVASDPRQATLIDFGIARQGWSEASITATGLVVGTPGYLAPEQARGSTWIDARADVFALGCVLYKCLTGRRAFRGQNPLAVLTKTVVSEPPRPRELVRQVPLPLDELVMRMLKKDPRYRPSDALEVADALARLGALDDHEAAPTSDAYPLLTTSERRLASVLLIAPPWQSTLKMGSPTVIDPAAPTLTRSPSTHPEWTHWVAAARAHGVRLEPLADGSIAAVLTVDPSRSESVQDGVIRMGRAALALRIMIPKTPMVLVTGRGSRDEAGEVEIIDRAAQTLANQKGRVDELQALLGIEIDRVTATMLGGRFDIEQVGSSQWLAAERGADAPRTVAGRLTPFVGREQELVELGSALEDARRRSTARAFLVRGSAGIGKSRLLQELLVRVRRQVPDLSIWFTRANASRPGDPFALLGRAVRRGLNVRSNDPVDKQISRIHSRVSTRIPEPDRERVVTFLAELSGARAEAEPGSLLEAARRDAALLKEQMLRAWLEFIVADARAQPILIVVEDLQWGDAPSLEFIERALRHGYDHPLFALGVARPEADSIYPQLWFHPSVFSVQLGGLSRRKSAELVRAVLGESLARADLDRIVERADGNPFVLEELMRTLIEGGGESMPETVLALVEARLERLSPDTRRVLRAASIYGETFWPDAVEGLVDDLAVGDAMDELLAREFVTRVARTRFPPHPEFAFRYSLVREAAYAMLTPEDRGLGHALAARWLARAGETDAWTLAEHHRLAHEPGHAAEAYRIAAEAALSVSDFATALARVDRAFECAREAPIDRSTRGALHVMEAEARRWTGDPAGALHAAEQALGCFQKASVSWFRSLGELCAALGRLGEYDRLGRELTAASHLHPDPTLVSAQIIALCPGVAQLYQSGRIREAHRLFTLIEAIAVLAPLDTVARARLEQLAGFHHLHRGEVEVAVHCFSRARDAFREIGSSRNAAIEQVNLAHAAIDLGAFELAERELREALFAADLLGLSAVRAYANLNLGRLLAELGRLDEAEDAVNVALQLGMAERNPRTTGAARVHLAKIALKRGDPARAETETAAAAQLLEVAPPLRAGAFALHAQSLLAQGRATEAYGPARSALALVDAGQHEIFDALVRLAFAEVALALGQLDRAKEVIQGAGDLLVARASAIHDQASRHAFVERVDAHARTFALGHELGVTFAEQR